MHDAGTGNLRQGGAVCQQAVEQGARPIACGGVDDQARRFVQHDDGIVFIYDVQRHGFGQECLRFVARADDDIQYLAADKFVFGQNGLALCQHRAVFYPCRNAAARIIGQHFCQRGIQPAARQRNGDGKPQRFGGFGFGGEVFVFVRCFGFGMHGGFRVAKERGV